MKCQGCKQRRGRCISLVRLNWINEFAEYPNKISGYSFRFNFSCPFQSFSDILFHTSCSRKIVFSRGWTWPSNKPKKPSGPNCKLKRSVTVEAWFPVIFSGKIQLFFGGEGAGDPQQTLVGAFWFFFVELTGVNLSMLYPRKTSKRISCEFSMWRKQLPPLSLCIYFNLEPSESSP